jgi:hypothetical protein
LSLAYLTLHEDLQFHPFSCKWHNFIFLYGSQHICIYIFHSIYVYIKYYI